MTPQRSVAGTTTNADDAAARSRDRLGRRVPVDSPERSDHGVDVDAVRDPAAALVVAQQLLDRGFPFAAHEVLEARWKRCPDDERGFWQGLAQYCVAVTHQERGNLVGAERLRERAASNLSLDSSRKAAALIGFDRRALLTWLVEPVGSAPPLTLDRL